MFFDLAALASVWTPSYWVTTKFSSNPTARSLAATSLADETSSQHSSDQSDTRTEHSDEDVGEKAPKRSTSVKATKKPAAAKTEVNTHYRGPFLEESSAVM